MIATDATDLDALAAELQRDGVVVDQAVGSGEAQEYHDRIAELVRNIPFPVYVALVEMPDGVSSGGGSGNEALAALLHRRIGGAGLYVVGSDEGSKRVVSYGLDATPALVSLSDSSNQKLIEAAAEDLAGDHVWVPMVVEAEAVVRAAEDLVEIGRANDHGNGYPSTLDADTVDDLARRAVALHARSDWRPSVEYLPIRPASNGLSAVLAVLAGSAVALFLGQTLRGWPSRRRGTAARPAVRVSRTHPALDRVREEERVRSSLQVLARRLERAAGDGSLDQDLYLRAQSAREAAEQYADSDELVDLVGARALVRTGERDLARARGGKRGAYRACFFDPRHAEAAAVAGWRLGEGVVRVPCCRRCAKDAEAGREPATLAVERRGRVQPYYTQDDVWAQTGFGTLTDTFAADVLRWRKP